MKTLVLGAGGREHALGWALARSAVKPTLFFAPGNAGTAALGRNLNLKPTDFGALCDFVRAEGVELVVCGPEAPLVSGAREAFAAAGVRFVGPSAAAARLESSKAWAKEMMERAGVPTAPYGTFTELQPALAYARAQPLPIVVKADGPAAGKGVIICESYVDAEVVLEGILKKGRFGDAGKRVVVEAFLDGIECSLFALCDGRDYVLLPPAKDYKRIGEGDAGPNTGGMGAVSPPPFATDDWVRAAADKTIAPMLAAMAEAGAPFHGFLFAGLMVVKGAPYVLEYNVRMGDPETQAVLPRIQSDFLDLCLRATDGSLAGTRVETDPRAAVAVVVAAGGYPDYYETGHVITGLENIPDDVLVFHAGVYRDPEGRLRTAGGRVLGLTALAANLADARDKALAAAAAVQFRAAYYRRDVGRDLLTLSADI